MGHRLGIGVGLALVAAIWTLNASPVSAQSVGTTQGMLLFDNVPEHASNAAGTGHLWRFRSAPVGPLMPLEDLHIVLLGTTAQASKARDAEVQVAAYGTNPPTVAVTPGSQVTFTSGGPAPWKLDVVGRAMEPVILDSTGSSGEVKLDKPGRYIFRDGSSPSVTTYVIVGRVVADSGLTRASDNEASFDLGAVPAGTYTMRVYFRGENVVTLEREVTVATNGALTPNKSLLSGKDLAAFSR